MKKKNTFYNATSLALILSLAAFLLADPQRARSAAVEGFNLWARNVMPAVFPFFVLTGYISKSGYANRIGSFCAPVMSKALGVSGIGAFAYITAVFSGTPLSIKTVCDQYREGKLEREEAQIIMALCSNIGPIFVLSTIGLAFFQSIEVGGLLLAINYLSAIITAFILSFRYEKFPLLYYVSKQAPPSRSKAFVESVKEAVASVLNIGGFIVFFQVLAAIWDSFAGHGQLNFLNASVSSLLEVTMGTSMLGELKGESLLFSITLAAAAVSFGGLSIFFQCISYIAETDLKISDYLKAKGIQTAVGAVLGLSSCMLLPESLGVFGGEESQAAFALPSHSLLVLISFGIFAASMALLAAISRQAGANRRR
jgi:sporulation integral membrane protein YlbJ